MGNSFTATYLDAITGRPIEVVVANIEKDSKETVLKAILKQVGITCSSASELIIFMASNLTEGNVFPHSQRQLSKMSGKSLGAVNRAIRQLTEHKILKQTGNVYIMDSCIAELCRPGTDRNIGILYK